VVLEGSEGEVAKAGEDGAEEKGALGMVGEGDRK
jgi:hypothetical protein